MNNNSTWTKLIIVLISGLFLLPGCSDDELVSLKGTNGIESDMPLAVPPSYNRTGFFGLTSANELVSYSISATLNAVVEQDISPISGLQSGESILAIDFRPATGQLYGVSNMSRLYTINHFTGAARLVSMTPFSPAISGTLVGFDFNPTVDRIRLVTDNEQNLRLHPETGALAATDLPLNPGNPSVVAAAYTNSFAGAATTTLYDIDLASDQLFKQNPPNNGTLELVGSLGVLASGEAGFDISFDNSVAIAVLYSNVDGIEDQRFYAIDLTTGAAEFLDEATRNIVGVAIPTRPVAYAIDLTNQLVIFNPQQPGSLIKKAITNLQPGETILGIDMRPATSQLYALGSTSRIYVLNMSSGVAAPIGMSAFTPALSGTSFAFDFNPTVDRIRIISNTGQNLRVHPETGAVAFNDPPLNPGTPNVSASAYTNNFAGAGTTTLYDIDYTTDKLYRQIPPNNGTLVEVGLLTVDAGDSNGFDIGSLSGKPMAILTVGALTKIYSINLNTGKATASGTFPEVVRGFTLGLGF